MTDAFARPAGAGSGPEPGKDPAAVHGARGLRAPLIALAGVGAALIVGVSVGAKPASLILSGIMAAAAAVRGLTPGVGPAGVAVRTKPFDVAVLLALGAGIAVLALTAADV